MQRHPKYLNGDCSEEELYLKFLNNFETDGVSKQVSALSADDISTLKRRHMSWIVQDLSSYRIINKSCCCGTSFERIFCKLSFGFF
jgi:hypothetical protein